MSNEKSSLSTPLRLADAEKDLVVPVYLKTSRGWSQTRDALGVLVAEFHSNGSPLTFTAPDHTDFVEAFYRISQDRENKIVILTGAGGEFIPAIDFSSFGNVADPDVWSQVHDEGAQILENLANIRVPMIAAVEGRAHVHSEYALLANVIVAAKGRPLMMCRISQGASCQEMESLPRGATVPAQEGRKRSC